MSAGKRQNFPQMERIDKLKAFIEQDPADCFSRHALALELLKIGDITESIEVMQALIRINPNHTGTYLHLGKALERINRMEDALSIYKIGIEKARFVQATHDANELNAALNQLEEEMDL
jgi:tetratricopeptide (TPR) repeat protein